MRWSKCGADLSWTALFVALLGAAVLVALSVGRYPVPIRDIVQFLVAATGLREMPTDRFDMLYNVLVEIRLPRVLTAVLVGGALATSGAAFQAVFRNPLVSPDLMGVLAGSAFGAALGIVVSGSWPVVQASAFAMGIVAVMAAVGIARMAGGGSVIMLVLGGIVSGTLFTALLSSAKFVADPTNKLPAIEYWLMGNLSVADIRAIGWVVVPMGLGVVALSSFGRALDVLAMGDDEARSLGVPVTAVRYSVIALATLVSAMTVSLAGMVSWVGLIIPHVARLILGPGNVRVLPASLCLGAIFLLVTDGLSRTLYDTEIPIGILTALLGVPIFLLVLHRARKGWV